jgi:hypothetical protein
MEREELLEYLLSGSSRSGIHAELMQDLDLGTPISLYTMSPIIYPQSYINL